MSIWNVDLKKNDPPEDTSSITSSIEKDSWFSITSSTEKDSRFGCYMAISPDEEKEFKLYDITDFSKFSTLKFRSDIIYGKQYCSNCIDDDKNERLVALSCFDAKEMLYKMQKKWLYKTLNQYDGDENNSIEKSEIHTSLESISGVIRFLDNDVKISGSKLLINKTPSIAKIERFKLHQQLSISLSRLSCLDREQKLELLHTKGIYKILAIDFIDNNNKLLIVLEEQHQYGIYLPHSKIPYVRLIIPLKIDATHRLINSHRKILGVK
ncbi:2738_t:CDS:2 [Diversispora eburnea]|uniref:2738_t:CDS:1 n=1 Tax=Diversispora eburnea TaxID=1213867 RepID=A0A9N9F1S5_9GLOM|nr:2738_t:CDS:2 [Diversispora eburnea]